MFELPRQAGTTFNRRDIMTDKNETEVISSLGELFKIFGNQALDQGSAPRYYFRGESSYEWPLIPKLLRTSTLEGEYGMPGVIKDELSVNSIQRRILQRLKRYAVHLYLQHNRPWQGEHPSDWEWLCVAQHHGLPTLLSDWTINPLVALYFSAWKSTRKEDGAFYVMELRDKQFRDSKNLSIRIGQNLDAHPKMNLLEDVTKPLIVVPLVFTRRIEAQAFRFIYAGHAGKLDPNRKTQREASHEDEIFRAAALDKLSSPILPWSIIRKYRVLVDAKVNILRQLRNAQIHHGTLFPDLDGYSAYLASGGD